MLKLSDNGGCFACGPDNPHGLHLRFRLTGNECITEFTPTAYSQGYLGIVHGGILATVLDEVMANNLWLRSLRAVTAEIKVSFRRPAPVGERLTVTGRVIEDRGRIILCEAKAINDAGTLIASAEGKFVRIP